jgi:hypothetical protein
MLQPQERELFLDNLRPPTGYRFDQAIATTFSLDLVALMTAPLAFTFFDCESPDGETILDPIPLLEAVRRHGSRITMFCQAGRISTPRQDRPLFAFIEDAVFECLPPDETASFHPKVWVVRYVSEDGPVKYRLLCLSRNMTFDRCWDTSLRIDGTLLDRQRGFSTNAPLSELISSLPALSRRALPTERVAIVGQVADEIRRVKWDDVDGFKPGMKFWPLGLPGHRASSPLRGRIDRLLVVSPFVEPSFWTAQHELPTSGRDVLVSRPESIDALGPKCQSRFESLLVLADDVVQEVSDQEPAETTADVLKGLHAKIYVAEAGWDARWWVGSANASGSGFGRNVELLIELTGSRAQVGIDRLLERSDDGVTLRSLLMDYQPTEPPEPGDDALAQRLLDEARTALARAPISARVVPEGESAYSLIVELPHTEMPSGVGGTVRPLTLPDPHARVLGEEVITFPGLTLESVTPFFVFELSAAVGSATQKVSFVRRVDLLDAPEGRAEAALRAMLRNRAEVMRYLLFLLQSQGGDGFGTASAETLLGEQENGGWAIQPESLLESLAKTLAADPARLDAVARLVDDLSGSSDDLLPPGFAELWGPVWQARQRLAEERPS